MANKYKTDYELTPEQKEAVDKFIAEGKEKFKGFEDIVMERPPTDEELKLWEDDFK